jgi:hypothetical protein
MGARDLQVSEPDQVHAAGAAHLGQEHGPELAGADQADPDRAAGSLAAEQQGVQVHGPASLIYLKETRVLRANKSGENIRFFPSGDALWL